MSHSQILQYSWSQLDAAIELVIPSLKPLGFDAVAGLASGIIPAAILANKLNLGLHLLNPDHLLSFQTSAHSLLLVSDLDGSVLLSKLAARLNFYNAVSRPTYQSSLSIRTLSIHVQENAESLVDFVLEPDVIPSTVWIKYPWE